MVDLIFICLGYLAGGLILFCVVVLILAYLLNLQRKSPKPRVTMPVLVPLIIPTRSQPTLLHKFVVYITSVRHWKLERNWLYKLNDEITIIIPRGFRFDGASIPKIFWMVLSPVGLLLIPGLIHDYAYRYNMLWILDEKGRPVAYKKGAGRGEWDALFVDVGDKVNGIPFVNGLARVGLLMGSWVAWNKHRARGKVPARPNVES